MVAGQFCRGCTNSLGVAILKNKDEQEVCKIDNRKYFDMTEKYLKLTEKYLNTIYNCVKVVLANLLDTHSVVFVDTKNSNSKLGCGEISNGSINIQG